MMMMVVVHIAPQVSYAKVTMMTTTTMMMMVVLVAHIAPQVSCDMGIDDGGGDDDDDDDDDGWLVSLGEGLCVLMSAYVAPQVSSCCCW